MTRLSLRAFAGAMLGAAALVVRATPLTGAAAVHARHLEPGARPHGATSGGNGVNDVSCVSTGDCVAVGQYSVKRGFKAFLDVQRGATWSVLNVPLPGFANTSTPQGELSGVDCASGASCIAVGSVTDAKGHAHALLISDVGGSWKSVAVPLPAGADTSTPDDVLQAVSCVSSSSCAAVGTYTAADGYQLPLVLTGAAGSWQDDVVPLPANGATPTPDDQLTAVDCTPDGSCTAVGSYVRSGGGVGALLETETSGAWSDVAAPLPDDASAGAKDLFDAVSCTSGTSCVAVGSYGDTGGNQQVLLDSEVAGDWSNVVAGLPGDASSSPSLNGLNGVACSSSDVCVAVGVYETEDNYQEALVEVDASGTWTGRQAAVPPDANTVIPFDTLNAVSCPADGNCVAVGFYSSQASYVYPKAFLEVQAGGTWVAGGALAPANESTLRPYSELSTISCVSILGCVAGGVYTDLQGNAQALLDGLGVALTDVSVVPLPPTVVTVHAGHGSATVSWRPTGNGGSRITGYTVTASPGGRRCLTVRLSCTVRPARCHRLFVLGDRDVGDRDVGPLAEHRARDDPAAPRSKEGSARTVRRGPVFTVHEAARPDRRPRRDEGSEWRHARHARRLRRRRPHGLRRASRSASRAPAR